MQYDKNKPVQLLELMGEKYVLVKKATYDELLDKLEGLDTALDVTRSKQQASADILKSILEGSFSAEQICEVSSKRTIGERIKLIRSYRDMDQRTLAEKSGVSQTTISNLENGRVSEPSFEALDAIFAGLEVPGAAVYPLLKSLKSGG